MTAQAHLPLAVGVVAAVAWGAAVGPGLELLMADLEVNPFISTLGTATLLCGRYFRLRNGLQINNGIPETPTDLGSGN